MLNTVGLRKFTDFNFIQFSHCLNVVKDNKAYCSPLCSHFEDFFFQYRSVCSIISSVSLVEEMSNLNFLSPNSSWKLQVPGALCVLQEAGEAEVVVQIGESLLKERLSKSFKQDVVLAVALAYVDLSRDAMEMSPPDFINGCEVLERALKLLQVQLFSFILFIFTDNYLECIKH